MAAWAEWATSLARFQDIKKNKPDCGCDLHEHGCYRWLSSILNADDLSELCSEQLKDKKESFQELRNMLHHGATLTPGEDNNYVLHYKVLGIHEVCRTAFLWFTARHSSTLYDAEKYFQTGKATWGHSARKADPKCSMKRDLVAAYIRDVVSLQSEEQPNQSEVDVDVGDDDSDLEDIVFERDASKIYQVLTGGKKRGGTLNKRLAKRHMDPVLVKHLHEQFKIDMDVDSVNPVHIAHLTMFQETWKAVLKEMLVYIRKNKGASGMCSPFCLGRFLVFDILLLP
jgi:hypothetical protein